MARPSLTATHKFNRVPKDAKNGLAPLGRSLRLASVGKCAVRKHAVTRRTESVSQKTDTVPKVFLGTVRLRRLANNTRSKCCKLFWSAGLTYQPSLPHRRNPPLQFDFNSRLLIAWKRSTMATRQPCHIATKITLPRFSRIGDPRGNSQLR